MTDFDKIKFDFIETYGQVEGVLSIDLTQNLLRVLLMYDDVKEEQNLPSTYLHVPQNYEIGIEYDSLPRVEARENFAKKLEEAEILKNALESQSL